MKSFSWRSLGVLDPFALALLLALELLVMWDRRSAPSHLESWAVPLATAVVYLPLLWRRRRPRSTLPLVVLGSLAVSLAVPGFVPLLCVWLALYVSASRCERRDAVIGLALAFVPWAMTVTAAVRDAVPEDRGAALIAASALGALANFTAFGVGRWVRWSVAQRDLVARLAAAKAEADERNRIARELHDIVAHSVSLMVLQAAGAARVLAGNPAQARTALQHVDELGHQAIVELRQMLGLLTPAGPPSAAPSDRSAARLDQPHRLQDIDRLLERFRETGREAAFVAEGEPGPLDPDVDAAAYRIVQEALTNAVKYADPARPVDLRIEWRATDVRIDVRTYGSNDAEGWSPPLSTGSGLPGMRDRAKSAGGTLTAGPTDDGFLVCAVFPCQRSRAPAPGKPSVVQA